MESKTKIEDIAETICKEMSLELVELDIFQSGKKQVVRVYLWKEGGILVSDCSKFSREFEAVLDLEDIIPDAYNLEVSSPGVDRPLKLTRDFERNIGRTLKCTLVDSLDVLNGSRVVLGELLAVDDHSLTLKIEAADLKSNSKVDAKFDTKANLEIGRPNLLNAKVEIQF